jgi:hypothetical protein
MGLMKGLYPGSSKYGGWALYLVQVHIIKKKVYLNQFSMCKQISRSPVFILVALVTLSFFNVHAQQAIESWSVKVSGKVKKPIQGDIFLSTLSIDGKQNEWRERIELKEDATFTKTVVMTEPGYYKIDLYGKKDINLILYKSDIQISVDATRLNDSPEITGSAEHDFIDEVGGIYDGLSSDLTVVELNKQYVVADRTKDKVKMKELKSNYQKIEEKYHNRIADVLAETNSYPAAINLLMNDIIDKYKYIKAYRSVAEKITKNWPVYYRMRSSFLEYVDRLEPVGLQAPELHLPKADGTPVRLSSFRGRYVVLNFTITSDFNNELKPAYDEELEVERVYNKYSGENIIAYTVGIGLAHDRSTWDSYYGPTPGVTVSSPVVNSPWEAESMKHYKCDKLPCTILIDPDGVVIKKSVSPKELAIEFEKIFDEQPAAGAKFEYEKKEDYYLGLAKVIAKDGMVGYVDRNDRIVVPCIYADGSSFDRGFAVIKGSSNKFGCIDRTGREFIPPIYDGIYGMNEGLILAKLGNKLGFIDNDNSIVVPFKYDPTSATLFINGLACVSYNGKFGFVDKAHNIVVPFLYEDYKGGFKHRLAVVKKDGKWGAIDRNHNIVIPFTYDYMDEFVYLGIAKVALNDKVGCINENNEIVVPIAYDEITHSRGNLCIIENDKLKGIFNIKTKKELVPVQYERISVSNDMFMIFASMEYNKQSLGILDPNGKKITKRSYSGIGPFSQGLAIVSRDGKYGYVSTMGDEVIPVIYDHAKEFSAEGTASVRLDGRWLVINKRGEKVK